MHEWSAIEHDTASPYPKLKERRLVTLPSSET